MSSKLRSLSNSSLLNVYKQLLQKAPLVLATSNEELDDYYDKVFDLEAEIKRRMESNQ